MSGTADDKAAHGCAKADIAGFCPDAELVEHMRVQIRASPFHGEGYR